MALSWNEIKDRALHFSRVWEGETRERAEKDSFWNDFFEVFGIPRKKLASFEEPVKKLGDKQGFIDLFWKGTLLVEHKSKGRSLDAAYEQAVDYFYGIDDKDLPQYILVSDFERFRLYDLDEKEQHEFHIDKFHENIHLFGFMAGYHKRSFQEENPVNIKAAEWMGKLHDELKESGYEGHELEVFLVRILFCLFADDTSIFNKDIFRDLIENRTSIDGSDLGMWLSLLFQVLDTPEDKRQSSLDESLLDFPYVNGQLYRETLRFPAFNRHMREILLNCCALDWGKISPAIFGSMFQSVMNPEERRNLGAHYTSETNILKLIHPLFLDELKEELDKIKSLKRNKEARLTEYIDKLCHLKFLDPACGCGNFLVITYREIRLLEIEALKAIAEIRSGQMEMNIDIILKVDVDQFYGFEIDEFPARIAEVALWLMDHQMNMIASEELGGYYARLPLKKAATIINKNALVFEWNDIVDPAELNYILGNPPFYGAMWLNDHQRDDVNRVMGHIKRSGVLDYVSCWYVKASNFIKDTTTTVAFVSTNSITQGEQNGILWGYLFEQGIKIHFAHQTFLWKNEARRNAAVHVVIIGFAAYDIDKKCLFSYSTLKSTPQMSVVNNINSYLVHGDDVVIETRNMPVCDVPKMSWGSQPRDGGHFVFTLDEKESAVRSEPEIEKYIKLYLGGRELINNKKRYCLWLLNGNPSDFKKSSIIKSRITKVKESRLCSKAPSTRKFAETPTVFAQLAQPSSDYLAIPEVSSERRAYIPIGFLIKDVIASNKLQTLPGANLYMFGVITSKMHMAWVKYVGGRLKSDYSYSNSLIYNNFPWPLNPTDKNIKLVEEKAQAVLNARNDYSGSSLADLYDPIAMPPKLVKAHGELDRAVDKCYRQKGFADDASRMEVLFDLYRKYSEPGRMEE